MTRRRQRPNSNDPTGGEDSFLDIVANLVGVLIILLVVVAAHAGSKIHEIAISEVDKKELASLELQHDKTKQHAQSLKRDNHQMDELVRKEQALADQSESERDQLLVQLASARQNLDSRKEALSDQQKAAMERLTELSSLQDHFREKDSEYSALQTVAFNEEVIEHFPTPKAKTVFSDEIHFRIRAGQIVHVPMNELVQEMRNEWKQKAQKLEVANETTETVGPIGAFRLQYNLQAKERVISTAYGDSVERSTEFTRFVLVPTNDRIGVPLDVALKDDSDFSEWVETMSPETTTVSIWVYPDSFEQFNRVKKWLYQRGFKTACWPLSRNTPISGGPSGYRSTAQ